MLLRGREGTELELGIAGYQYPNEALDPWDSNALLVSVRVLAPEGSWEVVDPCLTTWEGAELVRWMAAIAARPDLLAGERRLALNEPNLTLTATAGAVPDRIHLQACFALERRPPWVQSAAGAADLCVALDIDRHQLAHAAIAFRADLARFPPRGDDPTL